MFSKTHAFVRAAALALLFTGAGFSAPAFAADTGSSGDNGTTNTPPPKAIDCVALKTKEHDPNPQDWVYSVAQKKCVKKTALNDHDLYDEGRALALAGDYDAALVALQAVRNQHDAKVLTMIGYSTRKLGHTDEGIAIYHEALAIDPNNVDTHEYLGEGYIVLGRVDLAELELDTVQKLCGGTGCEQFQDLQKALIGDGVWH